MHPSLTQIETDLTLSRRELAHRVAALRALRQQVRDAEAQVSLARIVVARHSKRRSRATTGKN